MVNVLVSIVFFNYNTTFITLQGPPTHIDTFQTNIFSWFNDTVIQSQWFLGSSDREIWYKTLFFHFINLTWPPHRDRITEAKVSSYSKDRNFTFRGEQAWHPPNSATPSNFLFPKSLDQELSADVSFVSVLLMVLSEY